MYAHDLFCKMVAKKTKRFTTFKVLVQLHHGLNAGKVNMQQLQRCGNNDSSHRGFSTTAFMLHASLTADDHLRHLCSHAWPTKTSHVGSTACPLLTLVSSILMTYIHGRYLSELWGLKITKLLPTHHLVCDMMVEGSFVEG